MINEYFGELCSGSLASLYSIKLVHISDFHPHKVYEKDDVCEVHNDVLMHGFVHRGFCHFIPLL